METENKTSGAEVMAAASLQKTAAVAAPAPLPMPMPNPLAHLAIPFQAVDYSLKGYHMDAKVAPDEVIAAAEALDREGFALDTITGVDWLAESQMELVYDFFEGSHLVPPIDAHELLDY